MTVSFTDLFLCLLWDGRASRVKGSSGKACYKRESGSSSTCLTCQVFVLAAAAAATPTTTATTTLAGVMARVAHGCCCLPTSLRLTFWFHRRRSCDAFSIVPGRQGGVGCRGGPAGAGVMLGAPLRLRFDQLCHDGGAARRSLCYTTTNHGCRAHTSSGWRVTYWYTGIWYIVAKGNWIQENSWKHRGMKRV